MKRLQHYLYWSVIWVGWIIGGALAFLFIFGGLIFSAWAPPR